MKIFLLALLCTVLLALPIVFGQECNRTLIENTSCYIHESIAFANNVYDFTGFNGTIFRVNASNLLIDCNNSLILMPTGSHVHSAFSLIEWAYIGIQTNVTIKNCIINHSEKGIRAGNVDGLYIINNTFLNTIYSAVLLYENDVSNIEIINNSAEIITVMPSNFVGVNSNNSDNILISGNNVTGSAIISISYIDNGSSHKNNFIVDNNLKGGISFSPQRSDTFSEYSNFLIQGNTISNFVGFFCSNVSISNFTISDNQLYDISEIGFNSYSGLMFGYSSSDERYMISGLIISGNTFDGGGIVFNRGNGSIYLSDIQVDDNFIDCDNSVGFSGFQVFGGSNLYDLGLSGNKIIDCTDYGVYFSDQVSAVDISISGNNITGSTYPVYLDSVHDLSFASNSIYIPSGILMNITSSSSDLFFGDNIFIVPSCDLYPSSYIYNSGSDVTFGYNYVYNHSYYLCIAESFGYTPLYTARDLPLITGDAIGVSGVQIFNWVPFLILLLVLIILAGFYATIRSRLR